MKAQQRELRPTTCDAYTLCFRLQNNTLEDFRGIVRIAPDTALFRIVIVGSAAGPWGRVRDMRRQFHSVGGGLDRSAEWTPMGPLGVLIRSR